MNITELELSIIDKIAYSDFTNINGAEPKDINDIGWVWANCIIESKSDGGVFSSLLKKGLVKHTGFGDDDDAVTLTESGFKVFQNRG